VEHGRDSQKCEVGIRTRDDVRAYIDFCDVGAGVAPVRKITLTFSAQAATASGIHAGASPGQPVLDFHKCTALLPRCSLRGATRGRTIHVAKSDQLESARD